MFGKPTSTASFSDEEIVTCIKDRLKRFDIRTGEYPEVPLEFRRAAVLLPISVHRGTIYILLTKRSKDLRSHPSAVSFPGGKRDETDVSDIETALREANEEIGLLSSCVKILAVLSRGITLPNMIIYPVVGLIPSDFKPRINPTEVECAFYVPLMEFISPSLNKNEFLIYGKTFEIYSLSFHNEEEKLVIYGFTARMCVLLAAIVYNKNGDESNNDLKSYFDHITQHFISSVQRPRL